MIKKLNIGFLSTTYHTSLILIARKWIEKKLGIKVDWKLYPSGPDEVKALAKKEIDIAYIGLPPVIIGIGNRIPLKCIAAGHVEGSLLIGEEGFKSFEELGTLSEVLIQFRGKMIASPPKGSIHDIIIRKFLKEHGIKDVEVNNFPWADNILDDFSDRKITSAIGTPALAVAAKEFSGGKILIPADKLWENSPSYGIITREDLIENSPELLSRFLFLHKEATDEIRDNPDKAAGDVSKLIGIVDEDFVKKVYRVSPKYFINLTDEFINSTKEFINALVKLEYIKEPVSTDDVFDFRIIEAIGER